MPFGELPFLLILTLETAIRGVLEHFTKFTGKHLFQSLFSNKVAGRGLHKKRLWHRCFPVNFVKF